MKAVFGDTSYFLALLSPRDAAHEIAVEFAFDMQGQLVTTEWVLTELANALCSTSHRLEFLEMLREMRDDPNVLIVSSDSELFDAGIALYRARPDKEWSLTDCISFVVMDREGIAEALTGDRHFTQAGFTALLA